MPISFNNVLCTLVVVLACANVSKALNLKVVISQTNAVIDAKPIINLTELRFQYNGVVQAVPDDAFKFSQDSTQFPESKCNDGITLTVPTDGSANYNICKSGNNLAAQNLTVTTGAIPFNSIHLSNAHGFNNPSGQSVGRRIEGATLKIFDVENGNAVIFSYTFQAPFVASYGWSIPSITATPSMTPTTSKPTTSMAPTSTLNVKIVISQAIAVIDPKPVINLGELFFDYKERMLPQLPADALKFSQESFSFPAALCRDGLFMFPLISPVMNWNYCKSGNDLAVQNLTIDTGAMKFDRITIYNAYGLTNSAGLDIGKRIEGATLQVIDKITNSVVYNYTFLAPFQFYYVLDIPYYAMIHPSHAPTRAPTSLATTRALTRLAPTRALTTRDPTPVPTTSVPTPVSSGRKLRGAAVESVKEEGGPADDDMTGRLPTAAPSHQPAAKLRAAENIVVKESNDDMFGLIPSAVPTNKPAAVPASKLRAAQNAVKESNDDMFGLIPSAVPTNKPAAVRATKSRGAAVESVKEEGGPADDDMTGRLPTATPSLKPAVVPASKKLGGAAVDSVKEEGGPADDDMTGRLPTATPSHQPAAVLASKKTRRAAVESVKEEGGPADDDMTGRLPTATPSLKPAAVLLAAK